MELSNSKIRSLLDHAPVARLATVNPDGTPHLVPIVFVVVGDLIYSPIDGKPKRDGRLARVRNLEANPRAALLIDHYDDDWSKLCWLRIDVEAAVVPATTAAVAALKAKYPQYATTPVVTTAARLLEMRALRRIAWAAADG